MIDRPLILVTNDDGYHAPGIKTLTKIMKTIGEVILIAPDRPQSGMSHAITVNTPLRMDMIRQSEGIKEYICNGTPVDCVKLALSKIVDRKPDLIVSGINHGSNSSINVIYSGTMAAVLEGAIEGINSIGFSILNYDHSCNLNHTEYYIENIARNVLYYGLQDGTALNVNIPDIKKEDVKGVKICRQAAAKWNDSYIDRKDPFNKDYFWLTGDFDISDYSEDTDMWALKNNYISIVPVQFDFTAHNAINVINKWNFEEKDN